MGSEIRLGRPDKIGAWSARTLPCPNKLLERKIEGQRHSGQKTPKGAQQNPDKLTILGSGRSGISRGPCTVYWNSDTGHWAEAVNEKRWITTLTSAAVLKLLHNIKWLWRQRSTWILPWTTLNSSNHYLRFVERWPVATPWHVIRPKNRTRNNFFFQILYALVVATMLPWQC